MPYSEILKVTYHLKISTTGKIQRNNYYHGSCGPSLTGKMSSVSLSMGRTGMSKIVFTQARSVLPNFKIGISQYGPRTRLTLLDMGFLNHQSWGEGGKA